MEEIDRDQFRSSDKPEEATKILNQDNWYTDPDSKFRPPEHSLQR